MLSKEDTDEAPAAQSPVRALRPLLVHFEGSAALAQQADVVQLADELADGLALTSAIIGAEGSPSRSWALFRQIVSCASSEEVAALVAHRSPVVRAYLAGYAAAQPALVDRAYALLADLSPVRTIVGTMTTIETVSSLVMKALVRAARSTDEARQALIDAAADDRLPHERRLEALEQGAHLGCAEVLELARAWSASQDAELRAGGLRALAKVGTVADLPLALEAVHDPRAPVRFAAAEALRLDPGGSPSATLALEKLLEDADPGVRAAAVATYAFRPAGREERLERLLRGEGDPAAPGLAALSLLAAGGDVAWSVLEPLLMQPVPSSTIPGRFWTALASVDDLARVPFMRRLLDSRAEIVRTAAMRFLGEARDWESEPLLRRSLDALRPADRATAATALARLGARQAVPDIAGRLRDVSDNVRAAAARALADLGAREAMSNLLNALAHEKLSTVREAIMEALHALETRGPGRNETWEG